ncbi:hypothetical protein J2X19_005147 [Rhodoferax ferrireducens]|uniref:HicB-like antitoxin of toxin-antitoxin system domain-containing protein n=1 Tax=Rhodoferax ferrireducens TaxID=192843 RepID=A0ABU2CGH7_9BURK|nr:hypothetical protein [Rhodoferax ferrireducens]MDR7380440.1 hypothetical protein [Rhodoferax ferrireducens]
MKKATYLRHISVSVDEPEPGEFYWTLMESTDDISVWTELEAAQESAQTYSKALKLGVAALEAMTEDLDRGPRSAGEDENASPVGS